MSMNQYMHPRNIYKHPPSFKQLALDYPEFRKYVTQDISGKVSIDFKNVEALRALTCTLLKKDFDLNLEIPLTKLIPTIPLRLNYILWIEDLLNLAKRTENVKGIDIGTGASCIYPLMTAKQNKWSMIATEIDPESIKYAKKNVENNSLSHLIKIVESQSDHLLEGLFLESPEEFDFCMCNPPFFSSVQELHPFFKARKPNRAVPKNAFCASENEVVANGGEIEYVSRIINESKKLNTQIKIYTTMIGHKSSLPQLKKLLREADVASFKQTEFCQGHTTRWGLAWTFLNIDLRKIPDSLIGAKQKITKPLVYALPQHENLTKTEEVSKKLSDIFKVLQFDFQQVKHVKHLIEYIIIANTNTWSNQRRKRREKLRNDNTSEMEDMDSSNTSKSDESIEGQDNFHKACDQFSKMDVNLSKKRTLEDENGYYNSKKFKTMIEEKSVSKVYLKFMMSVIQVGPSVGLELNYIEGAANKEALHQVLQYLKNNLV